MTSKEIPAGRYRVRIDNNVYREIRTWVDKDYHIRSREHETGGLLWGFWDDAVNVIWIFDATGPRLTAYTSLGN